MGFLRNKHRLGLIFLAIVGFTSLAAAGYLVVAQEAYTIYDDGQPLMVNGSYETVGEVLNGAGLSLRPEDTVQPAPDALADPGQVIQVNRARPVLVRTETDSQTYWTQQRSVATLLEEIGLNPGRTDQIFADDRQLTFGQLHAAPLPGELEIGRFLNITIADGAEQRTLRTAVQTVGQALQEAGIQIFAADDVNPSLATWLEPEMVITVQRSFPVTIAVDGRIIETRTAQTNPLAVLAEAGIGLIGADFTRPGPDHTLQPGETIEVVRVTEDFRIEDAPVPFQTLWQATDELEIDQRAVISYGVPGIQRQRIRVRYENGVPVSETLDGEWMAREPVNEVIGYGTNVVVRVVNTPQGPLEYWRVVRMRVTSYTAASSGKSPSNPTYGITASGRPAGTGVVAIDRSVVPFRSSVYVPGYGVGFAGDTGGGVRGRWIDLGYDEDEYVSWSGYVDVYYLTPVPAPDDINYLIPQGLP